MDAIIFAKTKFLMSVIIFSLLAGNFLNILGWFDDLKDCSGSEIFEHIAEGFGDSFKIIVGLIPMGFFCYFAVSWAERKGLLVFLDKFVQ